MNKSFVDALKPNKHKISPEATVPLGIRKTQDNIVAGEVKYVDIERQVFTADIFFTDRTIQDILIAQPFAGPSSFISGMPEVGSIVLINVSDNFSYLVGYIPAYLYSCDQKHIKLWPNTAKQKQNHRYYRHRKLRPGEVNLSSSEGAELFLSFDASLEDPAGDRILLRNSDNSIVQTSLNNYVFNSGIWKSSGIIQRPGLDDSDYDEGGFSYRRTLNDGRITFELKPDDKDALDSFYTEYLIEAQETGKSELPSNSSNEVSDLDVRNPVSIFSMGNFVGNNPNKPRTYSKLLGVKLFSTGDDQEGGFEFKALRGSEPERLGMAAMLYAPKKENYEYGALFGIDKEGHFYQFIPNATGGGIGNGRSMSILAKGSKKEIWGADEKGNAWDLDLKGSLRWRVGYGENQKDKDSGNRSIFIVSKGPAYYQYGAAKPTLRDFDNPDKVISSTYPYKKVEKIGGKERRELEGTSEEIIGGSQKIRIQGMKVERISGSASRYVGGDYNVQVSSSYSLKCSGEGQEGFTEKKITCSSGGHELTVFSKGDIKETIKVQGNRETKITAGDIKEEIVTRGSRKFRTTTGDYDVGIQTQGNLKHKTALGSITQKTSAGKAEISATLQVQVKTNAAMRLKGTKVTVKTATPASGAITKLSHLDYITGAPLQNSKTVSLSS